MFISCVCPTKNRQHLIGLAVESFLNQTYPNKNMLIVDDGVTPTAIPEHPQIRYVRLPPQKLLLTGQKRNVCCELAADADVIAHFDSDDWSHPIRLEEQLAQLVDGVQVVGYNICQFWDCDKRRAFELKTGEAALGTGQMYFRSYWERHRFVPQRYKEDILFSDRAQKDGVLKMVSGIGRLVVRRHSANTWGARTRIDTNAKAWRDIAMTDLPNEFWEDMRKCKQE